MRRLIPENQQLVSAGGDPKLCALNSSKWLECRTGRAATIRAVAIQRIAEVVFDLVADRTAQTLAVQLAGSGCFNASRHICNSWIGGWSELTVASNTRSASITLRRTSR